MMRKATGAIPNASNWRYAPSTIEAGQAMKLWLIFRQCAEQAAKRSVSKDSVEQSCHSLRPM
jgi:hypothetical protein